MTGTTVSPASRTPSAPYPVKSNNVLPFDGAGMTMAQIMNILHRLDPGTVAGAGAAYTNLGHELGTMAANLTRHAQTLAQNWTGSAARAAMTSFQELHDQTAALAAQAAQTGSALTWLGAQVLPKFQQLGGLDAVLSGTGATAAQAQAQKYISALSTYLVTANAYLPDQIGGAASLLPAAGSGPKNRNGPGRSGTGGTAGPDAGGTGSSGTGSTGTGGRGAGGTANRLQATVRNGVAGGPGGSGSALGSGGTGAAPGTGGTGSAADTGSAGGNVAGTSGTAGPVPTASPAPTVSSLQSATPVPDSTPGPAPVAPSASAGSVTGDLGAGAFSPLPVIPGLSGAGGGRRRGSVAASKTGDPGAGTRPGVPGADVPDVPAVPTLDGGLTGGATPLPEVPGLGTSGTGAVADAVPVGETAASPAVTADGPGAPGSGDSPGHGGLGAMPMAGGAPGQSEKERARRVWAYEDENVWGLPADCVPPLIEGG